MNLIEPFKCDPDRFRGCIITGAAGDALGYAVEFDRLHTILKRYGPDGITGFALTDGKAIVRIPFSAATAREFL